MVNILWFLLCLAGFQNCYGKAIPVSLEFASTSEETAKGLMQRESLEPDHGMLFIFSEPHQLSFWMYETWIDLSIAFLDEKQVIQEIYEMQSHREIKDPKYFGEHRVTSRINAAFALEMNKNWFAKHNVKPGDLLFWNQKMGQGFIITNP